MVPYHLVENYVLYQIVIKELFLISVSDNSFDVILGLLSVIR